MSFSAHDCRAWRGKHFGTLCGMRTCSGALFPIGAGLMGPGVYLGHLLESMLYL